MPHGFDEIVVQGVVRLVEIYPKPHALGHLFPVTDVAHYRFAASSGELGHPDLFFNFFLVKDAELFFNLVLDR